MRARLATSLLLSSFALVACGGTIENPPGDQDATSDAIADTSADTSADASADTSADSATETSADTGADTSGDAGDLPCGVFTCKPNEICEKLQINGGALMLPDDAGVCPSGYENVGGQCHRLPTYGCVPKPASCGASIDCACAGDHCLLFSSCPYQCGAASGRTLECVCNVP